MPATMKITTNHNVSVTMYRSDEDDAAIVDMVANGTKVEAAEFIVLKNRLRHSIGKDAPNFFPAPINEEEV